MLTSSLLFNPLAQAVQEVEAQIEIPATTDAIWQSINKQTDELAAAIQSDKLGNVHLHAFAIRDLVAALPEQSGALPADKLAQVKASSQFVATLAERLDTTGDANDKAGTESNFQKLQKVLKSLQENYSGITPDTN